MTNIIVGSRRRLTADTTFYVRTDGSDSNDGSANDSSNAFLTIQGAYDYCLANIDGAGYDITLKLADGTYSGNTVITKGITSVPTINILGNATTPTNVVVTSASGVTLQCYWPGVKVDVRGVQLDCAASAATSLRCAEQAYIQVGNVDFAAGETQISSGPGGGHIFIDDDYSISGSCDTHINIQANGTIEFYGLTVTLSGTPDFASGFAYAADGGVIQTGSGGMTYSGSGTGVRYRAETNGVIQTFGGGASFFPGDSAGSTAEGGLYT